MRILDLFNQTTGIGAAITAIAGAVYAFIKKNKSKVSYIKRLLNADLTAEDLRNGLDNLSQVVDTQGMTIDWMTSQLQNYREELTEARDKLKDMENIHQENVQLKNRVAELENQVKALEEELARRKKYTPKDKRSE
jgi:predicted RNase H-like nuclease (RuvC/YqgF family)